MDKQIDVLAVMEDAAHELHDYRTGDVRNDLLEARAAVAELIAAGRALIGKRGAVMALSQTDPRWVRYVAALARVQGGA